MGNGSGIYYYIPTSAATYYVADKFVFSQDFISALVAEDGAMASVSIDLSNVTTAYVESIYVAGSYTFSRSPFVNVPNNLEIKMLNPTSTSTYNVYQLTSSAY